VSQDLNVLALVKGEEHYIFLYTDDKRRQMLQVLGQFASHPDLSFNWCDAAVLGQSVRREAEHSALQQRAPRFEIPAPDGHDVWVEDEPLA
jgi:hypothetical protein